MSQCCKLVSNVVDRISKGKFPVKGCQEQALEGYGPCLGEGLPSRGESTKRMRIFTGGVCCPWAAVLALPTLGVLPSTITKHLLC